MNAEVIQFVLSFWGIVGIFIFGFGIEVDTINYANKKQKLFIYFLLGPMFWVFGSALFAIWLAKNFYTWLGDKKK